MRGPKLKTIFKVQPYQCQICPTNSFVFNKILEGKGVYSRKYFFIIIIFTFKCKVQFKIFAKLLQEFPVCKPETIFVILLFICVSPSRPVCKSASVHISLCISVRFSSCCLSLFLLLCMCCLLPKSLMLIFQTHLFMFPR